VIEACRIARWRGYVASRFYAVADNGEPLLESAPFRWRAASLPHDLATARQAHAELLAALLAAGWLADGADGPEWYATRFVRAPRGDSVAAPKLTVVTEESAVPTSTRSLGRGEPPLPITLANPKDMPPRNGTPVRTTGLLPRISVLLAAAIAVIATRRLR
jgi:hypothetical protein